MSRSAWVVRWFLAAQLAVFVHGCGGPTTEEHEDALLDLRGVPVTAELAPHLEAGWTDVADPPPGDPRVVADLRRFEALVVGFQDPATRDAAADTIYSLWSDQPHNLLWFDLAWFDQHWLDRPEQLRAMLARPALRDTSTAVGRYAYAVTHPSWDECRRQLRAIHGRPDTLSAFDRVWMATKVAWVEVAMENAGAALPPLLAALPEAGRVGGPGLEAHCWLRLTDALVRDWRLDDALHAATVAEALARRGGLEYRAVKCRIAAARVLGLRGERDAAVAVLRQCIEDASRLAFAQPASDASEALADNLAALGRHDEALPARQAVLAHYQRIGNAVNTPRAMISLAFTHRMLGQLDACRAWQDSARHFVAAHPYPGNVALLPVFLAPFHFQVGEYDVADSLVTAAFANAEDGRSRRLLAEALLMELVRSIQLGRPAAGYAAVTQLEGLGDALAGLSGGPRNLAADCQLAVADFYALQGEFLRARSALARADSLLQIHESEYQRWLWEWSEGKLALLADDPEGARRHFARGLAQAERVADPDRVAAARYNLGRFHLAVGDLDAAQRLFAAEGTDASYGGNFRIRFASLLGLADVSARQARHLEALAHCDRAEELATRVAPRDLLVHLGTTRGRSLAALGRHDESEASLLAALAELTDRPADAPTADDHVFASDPRHDLLEVLIGLYVDQPELTDDEAPLRTLLLAEHVRGGLDDDPAALRAWIRRRPGALVATFVGEDRGFAWVAGGGAVTVHPLPGRADLAALARSLLASLNGATAPYDRMAARRLGALILEPALSRWSTETALTVISDRELQALPWSMLVVADAAGESPAVDRGPVVEAPSLASLLGVASEPEEAGGPGAGRLLALGSDAVAATDSALPRLRQAEREAHEVAALWPAGMATTGLTAGATLLTEGGPDLAAFQAIHLATHTVVQQGIPGRSTLRFGDPGAAPLTVDAIADLHLDADLVYLSCCEAVRPLAGSVGSGDLCGAFLAAGARSVIASPLRVDDAAARELALAFYRHWLGGKTRAAALRAARLEIRSDPRWRHPYYWATFRIVGEAG